MNSIGTWKMIVAVVTALAGGGAVIGAAGKAFYVTRAEYNDKVVEDAAEKASTKQILERIDMNMARMQRSVDKVGDDVSNLSSDVAVINSKIGRGR